MKKLWVLFFLSSSPAFALEQDTRRAQCIGWMMSGYPSGLEETACTAQFSLPSPFLFKCVRAQRRGFESATQKRACQVFYQQASAKAENGYLRRN